MNPNRVVRRVSLIAACTVTGLLLPDCTKTPDIGVSSGNGGAVGDGGQTGSMGGNDTTAATGGADGRDAAIVTFNLDAPPAWWGTADAEPDLPPAPTADANCGMATSNTTRESVDVLLVLDCSASMDYSIDEDCYCSTTGGTFGNLCADTTNCTTRWNAIEPAVTATLSSSSNVDWGLKFFPSSSTSNCGVTAGVEVKIDPNSAAAVQADIANATKSLGTPTTAAINAATAYLQTLTDSNKKVILVATDGEPNCGGSPASINTDDVTGASTAAAAALTAGFPVYVVGIGPNLGNLTQLASAGGTTDYFPANSPQQLADALSSISKLVGSCSFTVDPTSTTPQDPNNIAVYVNKQQVAQDSGNGWTFGSNPQEIVLTGSYCDDITAGKDTSVQILFGCEGAPPFPPYVP